MIPRPEVVSVRSPTRLSPVAKLRLAAEVLGAHRQARRAMHRSTLTEALAELRNETSANPRPIERPTLIEAARLGRVVGRVLAPLPLDSRCLMRSLVLTKLLARREITSRVVIGVKGGEEFGAHAWVELGGTPVLAPGGSEFDRLVDL